MADCTDIASDEEAFFNALVHLFERALSLANTPPASAESALSAVYTVCGKLVI